MHLFATLTAALSRPVSFASFSPRPTITGICLLAVLGSGLTPAQAAGPRAALEPRVALTGSAPPARALRGAQRVGRLAAETTLRVGLTLPLRHQSALTTLLQRQYTPGDALYHQFLTPPDFTARFGPTADDYAAVAAYARAQGLTITATTPGRTLLTVSGPSARIESAFGVQMSRYHLATGQTVFANSAAPRLPRSVAVRVAGIAGLNNIARMRPRLSRMKAHPLVGAASGGQRSYAPVPVGGGSGGNGSGPLGGLAPNDIKYAYDLDTVTPLYGSSTTSATATLNGSGQNIGLFELDGYTEADIALYVTKFSLPTVLTGASASVTPILLGDFKGIPLTVEGQTEVELDIDMVLALAPAATGVYVYEDDQTTDPSAALTIFTRMANDLNPNGSKKPLLQVISCSWGIAESLEDPAVISGENALFQQMATQGQSLFCASGDFGAYDLFDPTAPAQTAPEVDNPASQPYATGVGGTTLTYTPPTANATTGTVSPGAYISESAWSAGTALNPEGSGGGVSSLWSTPSYQFNPGVGSSPSRRNVPDVSLNADPNSGYSIYAPLTLGTAAKPVVGVAAVVGGTSAAAPLWAAYTALVNQQRAANGLSSLGFVNPVLYPLAAGNSYSAYFHDVTTGDNLFYQAGPGYDNATGLGSFRGAPLLTALSANANQGSGTATLTGTVTDSGTPAIPVAGATVTATVVSTGAVAGTAITDSQGAYSLTVPSGLDLIVSVSTTGVTSPTTESLTGTSVSVAALASDSTATQSFALAAASFIYPKGLQMISAPFDYSGIGDFASVFGLTEDQAKISPRLVQYAPLLNSYVFYPTAPADTLRLGQGYWVKFPSAAYLHLSGTPASTAQAFSIALKQGWNQIGDPFAIAVPLSTATVTASDGTTGSLAGSTIVQPTLYGYTSSTGLYTSLSVTTDSLQPYAGYWVFAFQASTLNLPYPGPPGTPVGG